MYTGGCFEGNKAVIYETAYPGEIHDFKNIQFEARLDTRTSAEVAEQLEAAEEGDFGDEVGDDGNLDRV